MLVDSTSRIAVAAQRWRLTSREHEVVELVAQGHTNMQIASAFSCHVSTVNKHLEHVLKKVGAENRTGLVKKIWTNG